MSLPLCFLFDNPLIPQKLDLIYLFCYIALAYLLGLSLMSLGYRYVSVYRGSVIQNLEIVFCSLFGVIFLKETLTAQMGVGAFLALISAVMISTSKSK
jgi:drug/metabolite transporter (DMT)-like permease